VSTEHQVKASKKDTFSSKLNHQIRSLLLIHLLGPQLQ